MGYIYKITNKVTNKSYVGKTTNTIESRFKEHISNARKIEGSSQISKSLREYGTINHSVEVLEECDNTIILEREQYWINQLNSLHTGYNIKNEFIAQPTCKYWGDETTAKKNKTEGLMWNTGISPSDEVRIKISNTKKLRHSLGMYSSFGHRQSDETKRKISEKAKTRLKDGLSDETKKKLSSQSANRKFYYSMKNKDRILIKPHESVPDSYNPGKGTCWMNKDGLNVSINIWDKTEYLNANFNEGRVNAK